MTQPAARIDVARPQNRIPGSCYMLFSKGTPFRTEQHLRSQRLRLPISVGDSAALIAGI